jgi:hypothetical protein
MEEGEQAFSQPVYVQYMGLEPSAAEDGIRALPVDSRYCSCVTRVDEGRKMSQI